MCHKSCLIIGIIVNSRVLQDNVDAMLGEKHEWVVGGICWYLASSCHEGVIVDGL